MEATYLTLRLINAMGNRAETTARLPGVEANLRTIYNNLTQLGSIVSAR